MASHASTKLNLAKFAFNIYGSLGGSHENSYSPSSSINSAKSRLLEYQDKLYYQCDREIVSLTQLNSTILVPSYQQYRDLNSHVVIGGKNYLQLLVLNEDQQKIIHDINILDNGIGGLPSRMSATKLNNINTLKAHNDTVVCGLSSGQVSVYNINNNGKSKLMYKLSDHKRTINSVDFVGQLSSHETPQQIISGSQDGTIKLWDLRTVTLKPMLTILPSTHSDPLRSCQYSPHSSIRNKTTILSVHDSGALCKLDLRSIHNPERKWNIHTGPALSLHIHPEKEYVVTGGRDQKMCVWNYGDSSPGMSRVSTEHMINTFSPVMKVRWNSSPNNVHDVQPDLLNHDFDRYEDSLSYDERESLHPTTTNNSLYNYDFACLYLNDDSTISIYNLNRKYIPKEIITTPTNKPFQNFVWQKCNNHSRKLWTLSKSNAFITYDLDIPDQPDVKIPLQELTTVSLAWKDNIGDLVFVNQEKYEYELPEIDSVPDTEYEDLEQAFTFENTPIEDHKALPISIDYPIPVKPISGSNLGPINNAFTSSSVSHSPIEKLSLHRSLTHNPMQNTKSPSPIPQRRGSNIGDFSSSFRASYGIITGMDQSFKPKLSRNPSQSTVESVSSLGSSKPSASTPQRKSISISHPSPYVIPLSLPLPLNDELLFESLAHDYLISIPDGFNLIDVCRLNASVATNFDRLRDGQVWRILAVGLSEDIGYFEKENIPAVNPELGEIVSKAELVFETNLDQKSILSELGNFASSFNSNSSLRTNYGGTGITSDRAISLESLIHEKLPRMSVESRNSSTHNLKDLINRSRGHSFTTSLSPTTSKSIGAAFKNKQYLNASENENAIVDDEDDPNHQPSTRTKSFSHEGKIYENMEAKCIKINQQSSSSRLPKPHDLDNENFNIVNNAVMNSLSLSVGMTRSAGSSRFNGALGSSASYSYNPVIGSTTIRRGSSIHHSRAASMHEWRRELKEVLEFSEGAPASLVTTSELTKAINEKMVNNNNPLKPWGIENLLKQALEYSDNQGDIVLSATLTLLFFDRIPGVIEFLNALNLLGLYIELLQRKRLFVIATTVMNEAPKSLAAELKKMNYTDIDLRFFCCWCEKLLINERSKNEMNNKKTDGFGYWYCDNCSRIQLNCIYCCEPCQGLAVVISLKCGHRGHFGCLREWFIDDENIECPGGCDYNVI